MKGRRRERQEEKERKEDSLQGWIWSGGCPSLWFYLASSFTSLNTIKALWFPFCFPKAKFLPSALLFLLCWPLTWLNPSLHAISVVRPCLTTPSDPYSLLNRSIFSHFVFITLLPSENVCFLVYLLSVFSWEKETLWEQRFCISNFHLAECLAHSNPLTNVYLINQQSSE